MIRTHFTVMPATTTIQAVFPPWIAEACDAHSLILDVGAGRDRNRIDEFLQPRVSCLVGIDPTRDIFENPSVHEQHQTSLEDFAKGYDDKFDVLFAMMVLEHVTHPVEFFSACRALLKPGGTFFAVTPNLWHYFGLITNCCSMLRMEEWVLDRLIGTRRKAEYHFPTAYQINSPSAIRRMLTRTGFRSVEFRCFDAPYGYNYVIPQPLRWFPQLYSRLVYRLDVPQLMGTIMFRATV